MKVKFSEVTEAPPDKLRSYKDLFRIPQRKHDLDSSGKPITLPNPVELNTLVLSVKKPDGVAREKAFDFFGNKLIISRWKKRELTPELIQAIETIGNRIFFNPNSYHNNVIHSHGVEIYGNANFVENSPNVKIRGDGCFVQDTPDTLVEGNGIQIAPYLIPAIKGLLTPRKYITASDFYSYDQCPHRVWRDANLPPEDRDPASEFLKLLWEKGVQYGEKVIGELGEFEDLSTGGPFERAEKTLDAMKRGVPLIYHGLLIVDELCGEPDILQLTDDGQYIPIDIKAAMALEGADEFDEGKLKEYYAMQLGLYVDALMRLGFATEKKGIIFDIDGRKVIYDLNTQRNSRDHRSWWEVYQTKKEEVIALVQNKKQNEPALFSGCKLCHWYSACKAWCEEHRDLSLVYKLGRSAKETLVNDTDIRTIDDLAKADIGRLLEQKQAEGPGFLRGIGEGRLIPWKRRAEYTCSGASGVKILNPFTFPQKNIELFFDIEADPTQNLVYLHGVYERRGGKGGATKFYAFVAKDNTEEAEKQAWKEFWDYVRSLPPDDYSVYHYSHYERTVYNKMREKYPDVVTQEELDKFFKSGSCVDLYKMIDKDTDWPLKSYSIKSIAQLIGFKWRDSHPSGAASIQWYNEYLKTKDPEGIKRILEYNEDDCIAELVVKDYLEEELSKLQKESTDNKTTFKVELPVIKV